MRKDYDKRLESLNKRRFDDTIRKAVLSESFFSATFGKTTKYVLESMKEIDLNYAKNTIEASNKIQTHLTTGLNKVGIFVEFEHQGSVPMNTHIKLHSDIDLVVIHNGFFSLEPPLTPTIPYAGQPLNDLKQLREKCFEILNNIYEQIDNSNSKSIAVYPTQPKRKVDVVLANWYDSLEFINSGRIKKFRGFNIYDYHSNLRKTDYPLLNISNINDKDSLVNGSLKRAVRFLKTLKVDADYEIKLSSFEISSIVYNIDNFSLNKSPNQSVNLLPVLSYQLNELIINKHYRDSVTSANGKEKVFKNCADSKVLELKKLKKEIDEIIEDLKEEFRPLFKSIDSDILY